jgi:ABC-type transport system involved in multi-copper enzyme maturation permease subunit/regulation of enolase protein 1 (concanavalin A-like superfamily)
MRSELRSEWTKLRTVRGWVAALVLAAGFITLFGLMPGRQGSCGKQGPGSECVLPTGPGGELVSDSFSFVHRTLTGDGSITVRVTSLRGQIFGEGGLRDGLTPWAKAGLIVKDGTGSGSAYAAVMVTGDHGVRQQHNYTNDKQGPPDRVSEGSPVWLRLTRTADSVKTEESTDGTKWTVVGTAVLKGLPQTVQAGMFATSPQYSEATTEQFGLTGASGGPSLATAVFDSVEAGGGWSGEWQGVRLGGPDNDPTPTGYTMDGGVFTVAGSGDIAPAVEGVAGLGTSITATLVGTFAGLIAVVVLGAMFVTAEYRRGLIRVTMAAGPRRGRVLAAKAAVLGGASFMAGLVSAAVVVTVGPGVLRANGVYVAPADTSTQIRLIVGTAALLAVASVLALAFGTLLRRSASAVVVAVMVIVMPYLLSVSVLPAAAGEWLLRISPAAAFAIQQTSIEYAQVSNLYIPADGYYPLAPWAGFAVLCAWTAAAMGAALVAVRRRDVR